MSIDVSSAHSLLAHKQARLTSCHVTRLLGIHTQQSSEHREASRSIDALSVGLRLWVCFLRARNEYEARSSDLDFCMRRQSTYLAVAPYTHTTSHAITDRRQPFLDGVDKGGPVAVGACGLGEGDFTSGATGGQRQQRDRALIIPNHGDGSSNIVTIINPRSSSGGGDRGRAHGGWGAGGTDPRDGQLPGRAVVGGPADTEQGRDHQGIGGAGGV